MTNERPAMASKDTMQPLTQPLTKAQVRDNAEANDGKLVVVIALEFGQIACSSDDNTYDGLNDIADEEILGFGGGSLLDLSYRPVGVQDTKVLVEVTADPSMVLEDETEA